MNAARIILAFVALAAVASAQLNPASAADERYFNLVDAVQHSEVLSDAELATLSTDDLMRRQLASEPPGSKLTQDGLEAATVHLCGPQERDLIVIGNGAPYIGANIGPFWIIRDLPTGPAVVLAEVSLSLSVDTKRSNKCLNVEAFSATAIDGITVDYKFDGQRYIVLKQRSVKLP